LKELSDIYGGAKFYFIIGTDNLPEIKKWRAWEDVVKRITLCVAKRPGYDIDIPDTLTSADVKTFPGPEWGNSSTLIRDYIKNGHSCKFLLPDAVIGYIAEKGLYGYINR
jgi:nicotinate-nucleotide adenylyltransferase